MAESLEASDLNPSIKMNIVPDAPASVGTAALEPPKNGSLLTSNQQILRDSAHQFFAREPLSMLRIHRTVTTQVNAPRARKRSRRSKRFKKRVQALNLRRSFLQLLQRNDLATYVDQIKKVQSWVTVDDYKRQALVAYADTATAAVDHASFEQTSMTWDILIAVFGLVVAGLGFLTAQGITEGIQSCAAMAGNGD